MSVSINWNNIHIGVFPVTNEILICKGKEVVDKGRTYFIATDKSNDRTQEVMDATIKYLLNLVQRSGSLERKAIIEREGMYRLTFEDLSEAGSDA